MGLRGPLPKDPAQRQRRNKPVREQIELAPVVGEIVRVPVLRSGMLKSTREAWETFWTASPLAQQVREESDIVAFRRLFTLYDDRQRAHNEYRRAPLVMGDKGYGVNPIFAVIKACDAEIRALEDRFGLTPAARVRLGIKFLEAAEKGAKASHEFGYEDDDEDA